MQVAEEILKALTDAGFPARIETVNALEAYLGSLPGHGWPNLRRPLLSTTEHRRPPPGDERVARACGEPVAVLPARESTTPLGRHRGGDAVSGQPARLRCRPHARAREDRARASRCSWDCSPPSSAAIPVRRSSSSTSDTRPGSLAHAAGATHYDLAAGRADALQFQPLARIDEPAERAWAAEWLETVLALQGLKFTPPLRARIDRALELVARNERPYRTLTELAVQLQHEALATALRPYTVAGTTASSSMPAATTWARVGSRSSSSSTSSASTIRSPCRSCSISSGGSSSGSTGSPTLIAIDEAWMALMHSLFGARVNQWLLQLRKANAAVVLATQSPAQLEQLPHRHTITDSCATRIYLPNPDATTAAQAALYRDLGLNDRQIAIVARAVPKRHYYFTSPRGNRLFELGLGPLALSFLAAPPGVTLDEAKREAETLMRAAGESWPALWLERRGLVGWADRYRTTFAEMNSIAEAKDANATQQAHA